MGSANGLDTLRFVSIMHSLHFLSSVLLLTCWLLWSPIDDNEASLAALKFVIYDCQSFLYTCLQSQFVTWTFASSNTTRSTFATNECFVCALFMCASSGQRAKWFFLLRLYTATIYALEHISNVANSYLAYWLQSDGDGLTTCHVCSTIA
jgi:hypothetical protein